MTTTTRHRRPLGRASLPLLFLGLLCAGNAAAQIGDTCANPVVLPDVTVSTPFSSPPIPFTFANFSASQALSCPTTNNNGLDVFLRFTPSVTALYRLEVPWVTGDPTVRLALHDGTVCGETALECRSTSTSSGYARIETILEAGRPYTIQIKGTAADQEGVVTFNLSIIPPRNNTCSFGTIIGGVPWGETLIPMVGATNDESPTFSGNPPGDGPDAYFQFIAPETATYRFTARSPEGGDPVLLVLSSQVCANNTVAASANASDALGPEVVTYPAAAGQLVRFSARHFNASDDQPLLVSIDRADIPSPNDTCATATGIALGPVGTVYRDTVHTLANTNAVNLTANPGGGSPDALWRITPDRPRRVTIRLAGTGAVLGIMTGECGSLTELHSQDNSALGRETNTRVLQPGVTYTIVAERASSPLGGVYDLEVEVIEPFALNAGISADAAVAGAPFRSWTIRFNQDVRGVFTSESITHAPGGSDPSSYELAYSISGSGEDVTVYAIPREMTQTLTMGFVLGAGLTGPFGNPLAADVASSLATLTAYPKGDVNKDGAFDINDVLLLSNASTGLATLP